MGNQGTADDSLRKAAAVIKSGVLGPVKEVHVWTNRPIWPQGGPRPEVGALPGDLDWNLWLGPAPVRPYADGYHPLRVARLVGFRHRRVGRHGLPHREHALHGPESARPDRRAGRMLRPQRRQLSRSGRSSTSTSRPWAIGRRSKLFWYDGGKLPRRETVRRQEDVRQTGSLVIGEKGKLFAPGDYAENDLILLGGVEMPEVKWTESPGHFEEWVRAIKGGEPAMSNFPTTPADSPKPSCWAIWPFGSPPPARARRSSGTPRT